MWLYIIFGFGSVILWYVIFSTYQTVLLVLTLVFTRFVLLMVIYQKPHCVDSRDVDSRHRFNECQLDPTEGWLSVFFSGSGCSSGSPVIARPLVSDPGLPSGFTSNRPWAGRWTPKLLLTSSCYGAISVRMCVWTGRASVGPNSTFTIYCTLALNSSVLTLLFTSFALLIQRFSCTLHL